MGTVNDLKNGLVDSASGPAMVNVAGLGSSNEHPLEAQLKILTALAATAAGRRAGIKRVPLRVGSPTGMRFYPPEDCR